MTTKTDAGGSQEPAMKEPPMTFEQFSATNLERCVSPSGFNHPLGSWSTSDWFTAVLGELGEAANIAKKLNRYRDGIPGNKETESVLRDKLRKELGDTFVYLDLLGQSLGVNIGAAAVEVFDAKSAEIGCSIRMPSSAEAPDAALRAQLQALVEKFRELQRLAIQRANAAPAKSKSRAVNSAEAYAFEWCAADLVAVLRPHTEEEEEATRVVEPK